MSDILDSLKKSHPKKLLSALHQFCRYSRVFILCSQQQELCHMLWICLCFHSASFICQVCFIFCKCCIDSFGRFMDLPHISCGLIWKIKKWISSTTCSSISASKRVYGGTEQISTDIYFLLSVCLISGSQSFFDSPQSDNLSSQTLSINLIY